MFYVSIESGPDPHGETYVSVYSGTDPEDTHDFTYNLWETLNTGDYDGYICVTNASGKDHWVHVPDGWPADTVAAFIGTNPTNA